MSVDLLYGAIESALDNPIRSHFINNKAHTLEFDKSRSTLDNTTVRVHPLANVSFLMFHTVWFEIGFFVALFERVAPTKSCISWCSPLTLWLVRKLLECVAES